MQFFSQHSKKNIDSLAKRHLPLSNAFPILVTDNTNTIAVNIFSIKIEIIAHTHTKYILPNPASISIIIKPRWWRPIRTRAGLGSSRCSHVRLIIGRTLHRKCTGDDRCAINGHNPWILFAHLVYVVLRTCNCENISI